MTNKEHLKAVAQKKHEESQRKIDAVKAVILYELGNGDKDSHFMQKLPFTASYIQRAITQLKQDEVIFSMRSGIAGGGCLHTYTLTRPAKQDDEEDVVAPTVKGARVINAGNIIKEKYPNWKPELRPFQHPGIRSCMGAM